ncbi:MAG: tRNA 2-thiouridine(34) synthase MnmA [Clostridia bacterium]|nr:tRNA 2-thiouridine(34) synthase MnmA [Clostridia bacterium]
MNQPKRAVLGLSGGVDSAVCAALLKREGYEVRGVYLKSHRFRDDSAAAELAACAAGVDFAVVDISDALDAHVVAPFVSCYLCGQTPNPCIMCNPTVKFPSLVRAADEFGAETIATGHYARIVHPNGLPPMVAASDCKNDQSYMLYRLPAETIARLKFPLAEVDKDTVRKLAAELIPDLAEKPDSMEICFIPDDDRLGFLEREAGADTLEALRGDFIDGEGKVLGQHDGIHCYTIGQRRGLTLAFGARAYVAEIDPAHKTVMLADNAAVTKHTVHLADCVWHHLPDSTFPARVRVRHSRTYADGVVTPNADGTATITFADGVRAPAPGQAAVCYADLGGESNVVLGGGTIVAG